MDRDDGRKIVLGLVLFGLGAAALVGTSLALGIAWRTFTWAAGFGG